MTYEERTYNHIDILEVTGEMIDDGEAISNHMVNF